MKNIKIIGIIVFLMLIFLVFFTTSNTLKPNEEPPKKVELNKENYEEVLNNGGSVLQYNGYIYYVKASYSDDVGFDNKVCRRKIGETKEEILYYGEKYKIGDKLIIFNNNLFFNMVGQTHRINLQRLTEITEYNKGTLHYIGNGKLIYTYNNNIFRGTYYEKTLGIKSIAPIATFNPNYMFEDEKSLYFYSNNDDESKSIVSVNKENQSTQVLDRIYQNENTTLKIIDFKIAENYIYVILDYGEYEIRRISKDGESIESVKLEKLPQKIVYTIKDNLYFKTAYDSGLYVYDLKENKIIDTENEKNVPDIYNVELLENNIVIYKNEEKWYTILENVNKEIYDIDIDEVEEYIYVRFEMKDEWEQKEIMFFRVKKDGSELEKLNNV